MCFRNGFVVQQVTETGWRAFHPSCKRYDCRCCGKRMKSAVIAKICSGKPNKLLTLTVRPLDGETPADTLERMFNAWDKFKLRIAYYLKIKNLQYFLVVELHPKSGFPHFHVFLRSKYIPRDVIKRHWEALTGAFVVDIRQVRDTQQAAYYAAKYIELADTKIGKHRRRSNSKHWAIETNERIQRPKALATRLHKGVDIAVFIVQARQAGDQFTVTPSGVLEVTTAGQSRDPPLWSCGKPATMFFELASRHETRSQIVTNWPLDHESVVSARI